MFVPLHEDMKTKKGKYDPWWFTVNISQYIIIIFYENDTNEVRFRIMMTAKNKKPQHILHIELGHGG